MGNKTGIRKERRGLTKESGTYTYGYDALDRLESIGKGNVLETQYRYDAFGNRIKKESGEHQTSYRYNALNQLINLTDQSQEGTSRETYLYDRRGNLSQVIRDGTVKNRYVYGALNRLEEAVNSAGQTAKYQYHGLGHRIGKEITLDPMEQLRGQGQKPDSRIDYLIDLTREYHNLLEKTEDGISQTYFWDGNVAAFEESGKRSYYLQDELGSPLRIEDELGLTRETYGYGAFGEDLYGNQGVLQVFGYTGYQRDNVAGTYYAQAREYQAEVGRFAGRDIIKGRTLYPSTINEYIYCRNRPFVYMDLNGKWAITLKVAGNATLLFGVGADIDFSFDDNGNIGFQWSYSVPFVNDTMTVGIADAGVAGQLQVMNVDSIYDLEGNGSYVGASGGYLGYGGIDLVTQERIADMLDEEIEGIQLQVGAGIGIDVHLMQSHTNTIYSTHIRWLDKLFEFLGVQEKNKTDVCSEE